MENLARHHDSKDLKKPDLTFFITVNTVTHSFSHNLPEKINNFMSSDKREIWEMIRNVVDLTTNRINNKIFLNPLKKLNEQNFYKSLDCYLHVTKTMLKHVNFYYMRALADANHGLFVFGKHYATNSSTINNLDTYMLTAQQIAISPFHNVIDGFFNRTNLIISDPAKNLSHPVEGRLFDLYKFVTERGISKRSVFVPSSISCGDFIWVTSNEVYFLELKTSGKKPSSLNEIIEFSLNENVSAVKDKVISHLQKSRTIMQLAGLSDSNPTYLEVKREFSDKKIFCGFAFNFNDVSVKNIEEVEEMEKYVLKEIAADSEEGLTKEFKLILKDDKCYKFSAGQVEIENFVIKINCKIKE